MTRAAMSIRKWTMLIHRWMGVGFCILFVAWFVSGIVMMYCPYPRVGPEERLSRSAAIVANHIRITPSEAYSRAYLTTPATQVYVGMLSERPVYRFISGRQRNAIFADTGEPVGPIPRTLALSVAAGWTKQPAGAASGSGPLKEPDQWTVPQGTMAFAPFWKFSWPNGEEVYVSQKTGEVVQHTTRGSRLGAWFGAVPHWIYFTPLRRDPLLWNRVVVWTSGAGTVMSLLGLIAGIWLYSPSRRYRSPGGATSVPYAGQKRLHVILGLAFGLVTCTWAFSGMMSMSPFSWLRDTSSGRLALERALRGASAGADAFDLRETQEAIRAVAGRLHVKELELTHYFGKPVYVAWESTKKSYIVPADGEPMAEFPQEQIAAIATHSARPYAVKETKLITEYETYYINRHGRRPLPVLRIQVDDPEQSLYYVDPKTARVVQSYGRGSRWNRWLYHGLHSFDLPLLYKYRPAWDIIVLILMAGGTWLCVTAVVIGWRRMKRKMQSTRRMYADFTRRTPQDRLPDRRDNRDSIPAG